jgi:hypothetical protein
MIQTNTIIDDLVIEEVLVYKISNEGRKNKLLCSNILDHKICYSCKQIKNFSEFHRRTSSKDGRYHECKECSKLQNPKDKGFSRQAKIDMVNFLGGMCIRCGYSHPEGIDFHHIDPSKKLFTIGDTIIRYPLKSQKWIDELLKCVPLCRNCHAEFHFGRYTLEQYLCKLPKFNENIQKQDFTGDQLILGFQIGCSD